VNGVAAELDAQGEYFYDAPARELRFIWNASLLPPGQAPPPPGAPPPPSLLLVAPQLEVFFNVTGSAAAPVRDVAFVGLGFALGFGGAMTFMRALQIRRLAVAFPPEAYVLETDAPDIPPAWVAPGRNAPGELPAIERMFAELRGESPAAVRAATGANARRVLPRLDPMA
jgi:hypothetical protein